MRPLIWICVALYALAMTGVSFAAHWIVGNFGALAGFAIIAATIGVCRYLDRREERKKIEILAAGRD